MTPARWQQIEALYHSVLEKEPAERGSYLAAACAGDEELRREIESLLAENGSLLDHPSRLHQPSGASLTEGATLGPYRIESSLGAGGMGEVFRARDTRLNRTVALKILDPEDVADPERKRRFLQEARAASALNHPNIVTLHDIAEDKGIAYLVMEYVAGTALGNPSFEKLIDYAVQIASALAAAHSAGIIHRDIKPSNVLVTPQGRVKVLDFGLAKLQQPSLGPDDATAAAITNLTRTGYVLGTIAYMSPEQARGEPIDARTDLFSFGAMLYEMATGRKAFSKRFDWTTPPTADLPPPLRPIILKLLDPDCEKRYQKATDVQADLERLRSKPAQSLVSRWPIAAAILAAIALGSAVTWYLLHGGPKLTDKDTVVLADFANKTGDPVFDDTLRQGLSVQLEQSPFLSLISDERIRRMLALMEQPPDAKLTPKIAQEVCTRSGSAAVLEGSLAPVGTQYVLGFTAKSCRNGEILDEEQVQVAKKEQVLNALSQIAVRFRKKAGESLATVKAHEVPLIEATTSSLEALQAYSAAQAVNASKGSGAAIPLFRRAVEMDPGFALASAHLGAAYGVIGESALAADSLKKAYAIRNRTSDPERFFISLSYEHTVTGNLAKAAQIGELWAQTYPRDVRAHSRLSVVLRGIGRHDRSLEEASKAIAIDPDFVFGYISQARSYLILDRQEEARKTLLMAAGHKLDATNLFLLRYYAAFLRRDAAAMESQVTLARGRPDGEDWMTHSEALVAAYSGRLQLARSLSRRAVSLARQSGQYERAAAFEGEAACYESFLGNAADAKALAEAALELSRGRDAEYAAAFALARAGTAEQTERLASDLNRRFPEDTLVQFQYLPAIRALAALKKGSPAAAIRELEPAGHYDLAMNVISLNVHSAGAMYTAYVRGEAFLAQHKGMEAAAEFQKLINHPGIVLADPTAALAHLEIARAWRLAGDDTKAKAAYQSFIELWKNADDLPLLHEAKAERAGLH